MELPEPAGAIAIDCGPDAATGGRVERYEDGFTADQMCAAILAEREQLRRLVLDDAWAMTFQTMGQYRTALAKAISKEPT